MRDACNAVAGIGAQLLRDRDQSTSPDRLFHDAVAIFFRVLVARLAVRAGRLPSARLQTTEPHFSRHGNITPEVATAAEALVALDAAPHAVLSALYEEILRYAATVDPVAGTLTLGANPAGRKASGSFYTPDAIARLTVRCALDSLRDGGSKQPTVLDPAMGTGIFLLEAARELAARSASADIAAIAEQYIYGVDRDPMAVSLAILGLWIETGARPEILAQHLVCGDLIVDPNGAEPVDVVVGNPPWGVPCVGARGSIDSFKAFLQLASRLSRGTVGMVLPQSILMQEKHADIRAVVSHHFDPYDAVLLPARAFPGAAAPSCVLVFGPKPGPIAVRLLASGSGTPRTVPARTWGRSGYPVAPEPMLALLERLQSRHPRLGNLSHLYCVRDVGINYNRASVAKRELYDGSRPDHPRDLPRYRGRDFGRYTAVARGGWIRHEPESRLEAGEKLSLRRNISDLPAKIVLRQTADRIVATLDRTRMIMGRSVIAITSEGDESLLALLACLNSRLITALYRTLAGETGRILPQVKVGRLLALPIPVASVDPCPAVWRELDALAAVMLARDGDDIHTENCIDHVVCRVYDLTPDEVALING